MTPGQDTWVRIRDWVFSDAGAGWVFGVTSLVVLVVSKLRTNRPNRVVFKEIHRIEPVTVREDVRKKVTIRFGEEVVQNLAQINADLFNSGSSTITKPVLKVTFPDTARILDASLEGPDAGGQVRWEGNVATIQLAFLNPFREHRHKEHVSFLLAGWPGRLVVAGMQEGWSVQHIRLLTAKEDNRAAALSCTASILGLASIILYGWWLDKQFGIDVTKWSWSAVFAFIPLAVPLISVAVWVSRYQSYRVVRE